MRWFNIFGLLFMAVIMIPNILFTIKCKDGSANRRSNKAIELIENIGRIGCFGTMIFNIPGTCFGWWFDEAFAIYLAVDVLLILLYCAIWIICWKKNTVFRALALSVLPSTIFLFSGVMSGSVLLIVSALLFGSSHVLISYLNVKG